MDGMIQIDPIIIFGVCIGATVIAIISANIWNSRSRKDRQRADKQKVGQEVARLTEEKNKEQEPLDDLERTAVNYKIESLETKVLQSKLDLADHIKEQETKEEEQDKIDKEKKAKSERYL